MRFVELDIFRGLAIIIMIIVDAPPAYELVYPILTHSHWQGLTVADLAFPLFVFAMGISAALSKKFVLKKFLVRVISLFLLGLMLNIFPDVLNYLLFGKEISATNFRVLGVLQRLALTYAFGSILCRLLKDDNKIICAAFLMMFITSAGFRIYNPAAPFDEMDNLSRAVDTLIIGQSHMYLSDFDPENLYGTINSTATMMFGIIAGRFLLQGKSMLLSGILLTIIGSLWSFIDIISKPLWTAPYVLIMSGIGFILMNVLKSADKLKILQPIRAVGTNPLFFYLITNVLLIFLWTAQYHDSPLYYLMWNFTTKDFINPEFGASIFTIFWCLLWLPLAEFFYRKQIIIKL